MTQDLDPRLPVLPGLTAEGVEHFQKQPYFVNKVSVFHEGKDYDKSPEVRFLRCETLESFII